MPKNIVGAWRAFSSLIQADISTAKTVDSLLYFSGSPMEPEADQFFVNKDEITGADAPTIHRLLSRKLMGKHKSKGYPHVVAMFASMAMGKDTSAVVGTTTAYKHKIEIDKTIVELPKRTMIENDGFAQKKFKGVACTGFQLSCQRDGFLEFEADLVGAGDEAADVLAKPSRTDESYLTFGDAKFYQGGAFDGTAVTGATELSTAMDNFTYDFKNNGKGVHLFGDSSGAYGSIRRGKDYAHGLKMRFEVENGDHRTAFLAGTEFVGHLPIVGGIANDTAHYAIDLIWPRLVYKAAKKDVNDGTLVVDGEFEVLADATYGSFVMFVTNLQAASYLAAA